MQSLCVCWVAQVLALGLEWPLKLWLLLLSSLWMVSLLLMLCWGTVGKCIKNLSGCCSCLCIYVVETKSGGKKTLEKTSVRVGYIIGTKLLGARKKTLVAVHRCLSRGQH